MFLQGGLPSPAASKESEIFHNIKKEITIVCSEIFHNIKKEINIVGSCQIEGKKKLLVFEKICVHSD